MPTSRPNHLAWLSEYVVDKQPKTILDVGIGFGTKGMLFREYTDICHERYHKDTWTTRIDGIEIFAPYITDLQREIYDHIYIGNALELIPTLGHYDLIYAGDIIEHMSKEDGKKFIDILRKAGKEVIIVTPLIALAQGAVFGNEHERHISQWHAFDFEGANVQNIGFTLIATYSKNPIVHYCEGMKFFGDKMLKYYGFKKYNPSTDKEKPTQFWLYFMDDYLLFQEHKGARSVYWHGSDVLHAMDNPDYLQVLKECPARHYCHNTQLQEELKSMGITAEVYPVFFSNKGDYPISYKQSDRPHVYIISHYGRNEEYGVDTVLRIAPKVPDVTFHIYGVGGKSENNIIFHGQVEEEEMDKEIRQFQGCLRLNQHDGTSQTVMKAMLLAQYPILRRKQKNTWQAETDEELIVCLNRLKTQKEANLKARGDLLVEISKPMPF